MPRATKKVLWVDSDLERQDVQPDLADKNRKLTSWALQNLPGGGQFFLDQAHKINDSYYLVSASPNFWGIWRDRNLHFLDIYTARYARQAAQMVQKQAYDCIVLNLIIGESPEIAQFDAMTMTDDRKRKMLESLLSDDKTKGDLTSFRGGLGLLEIFNKLPEKNRTTPLIIYSLAGDGAIIDYVEDVFSIPRDRFLSLHEVESLYRIVPKICELAGLPYR